MATHRLTASPATVHWGFYDASLPPVLTVASGDRVNVQSEPTGPREVLPQLESRLSKAFRQIAASCPMGPSSHLLNGPIAVVGAMPGDALEVHFERIALRYDWGFNTTVPLKGSLPDEFPYCRCVVVELDRKAGTGDWGAGVRVHLAPFFGNFGVAPDATLGRVPSGLPGPWGGNLDNKELTAGSRVLLPVFREGALFSLGDGHACQGDGEVNSFALETGLEATVRLRLRKDMRLRVPRAETPTHYLFMGFDPILDNAARNALRETLAFLIDEKGLGRDDAYALCSLAVDLRVTQVVNGVKGVHAMVARALLE
jgi:acetamidase/formamidase